MIYSPQTLDPIIKKLISMGVRPVIVGGYVRDILLAKESKDIDIELYNLLDLNTLSKSLEPFGKLNFVGKSFGVAKLSYKGYEIDFSLPRRDSKVAKGHRGFEVSYDASLDFRSAFLRRDFTINAMGYDLQCGEFIDLFGGRDDLRAKRLRAVDESSFGDDPLRVLRAVRFCSTLGFSMDSKLFEICQNMVQSGLLGELPRERIFSEVEKILLEAKKPSIAFSYLQKMGLDLFSVDPHLLDNTTNIKTNKLVIALALLCDGDIEVLAKLSNDKELTRSITKLLTHTNTLRASMSDLELLHLANSVSLEDLLEYNRSANKLTKYEYEELFARAKSYNVLREAVPSRCSGDELIKEGLKPSKEFKTILAKRYEAQLLDLIEAQSLKQ